MSEPTGACSEDPAQDGYREENGDLADDGPRVPEDELVQLPVPSRNAGEQVRAGDVVGISERPQGHQSDRGRPVLSEPVQEDVAAERDAARQRGCENRPSAPPRSQRRRRENETECAHAVRGSPVRGKQDVDVWREGECGAQQHEGRPRRCGGGGRGTGGIEPVAQRRERLCDPGGRDASQQVPHRTRHGVHRSNFCHAEASLQVQFLRCHMAQAKV